MQEEDDATEHENLAEDGGILREILEEAADAWHPTEAGGPVWQVLLQHLIDAADAEGADDRAAEAATTTVTSAISAASASVRRGLLAQVVIRRQTARRPKPQPASAQKVMAASAWRAIGSARDPNSSSAMVAA